MYGKMSLGIFEADLPLNRLWNDYDFEPLKPYCKTSTNTNYSRDFGFMLTINPLLAFLPQTIPQLQQFLKIVNKHQLKVTCRGKGGTTYGQSLCENGVIIDFNEIEIPFELSLNNDQYQLRAPAGSTWSEVVEYSLKKDLTVPVVIDYMPLTLGGTLSFGPIGGSSYKHGAGADNVLEMQVVTLTGELVTCSATENAQLFHAILCGLGQFAIVISVTLALIPAKPNVCLNYLRYVDANQFLIDQKKLYESEMFDHLKGFIHKVEEKWEYVIEAAVYYETNKDQKIENLLASMSPNRSAQEMTYCKFVNLVPDYVTELKKAGKLDLPHPWYNVFLPETEIATHLLKALDNPYLTGIEPIVVYPLNAENFKQPLFVKPEGETFYIFGILYNTSFKASADFPYQKVLEHNKNLYQDAKKRGGCSYPVDGTLSFEQNDWKEHFGKKWDYFCKMKEEYDPNYLLNSGMNISRLDVQIANKEEKVDASLFSNKQTNRPLYPPLLLRSKEGATKEPPLSNTITKEVSDSDKDFNCLSDCKLF